MMFICSLQNYYWHVTINFNLLYPSNSLARSDKFRIQISLSNFSRMKLYKTYKTNIISHITNFPYTRNSYFFITQPAPLSSRHHSKWYYSLHIVFLYHSYFDFSPFNLSFNLPHSRPLLKYSLFSSIPSFLYILVLCLQRLLAGPILL